MENTGLEASIKIILRPRRYSVGLQIYLADIHRFTKRPSRYSLGLQKDVADIPSFYRKT